MAEKNDMPLSFQMALAHNIPSMKSFLSMDDKKQDEIIEKAKKVKSIREMNNFVDNIGKSN